MPKIDIDAMVLEIRRSNTEGRKHIDKHPPIVQASIRSIEAQVAFARWFAAEVNAGNEGIVFEAAGIALATAAVGITNLLADQTNAATKRAAFSLIFASFANTGTLMMEEAGAGPLVPETPQTVQ